MLTDTRIGVIGFGRIGRYLVERIDEDQRLSLDFVCDPEAATADVGAGVERIEDPALLSDRDVDLVVEAAHADVVTDHGERLLETSDLLILSTTALSDAMLATRLGDACQSAGTRFYVPHGAVLGMDGLQDARPSLNSVSITTRKNPANIDFSHAAMAQGDVDGETTLYDGPTRGICAEYPRNVNSHATVAVSGLGFDRTQSTLVADPSTDEAIHHIVAEGDGTTLEVSRTSSIEGVTGAYTLDSIWGTVGRIVDDGPGLTVV
jgi:aspartate dehydrogenase